MRTPTHAAPAAPPSLALFAAALAFLAPLHAAPSQAASVFPGSTWEVTSPSAANLDAAKLSQLRNLVGGSGVVIRDGRIAYSWGDIASPRNWASASKPVLSTLLFLAVNQGRCQFDSPMSLYMPDGSAKDEAITFHQLANMTSGYSRAENPGAAWAYNDYAIQLYGYALNHGVFEGEPSAVMPQAFSFLEFEDEPLFSDVQYGRSVGVSIRDFARLGLLWLNRGTWDGVERIPSSFFDRVSNQVPESLPTSSGDGSESWNLGTFGGGDNQGAHGQGNYGYNFWVNTNDFWNGAPNDVFQAIGHSGGEVCIVFPSLGIVAAGIGAWGHPSTPAILLVVEAAGSTSLDAASWGTIKAQYAR